MQLASYLERGPLKWMMPLHLHIDQKSDYDYDMMIINFFKIEAIMMCINGNDGMEKSENPDQSTTSSRAVTIS